MNYTGSIKQAHVLLIFLFSICISFLLYGNSIKGGFVYDDIMYVNREDLKEVSSLIKVWSQPTVPYAFSDGLFHPVTSFTFSLNFFLFGESPSSFHTVNIVLNGIVVFLVFLLSYRLFRNIPLALFITLLYAFLPIHTEAVANIKGRGEILSALFGVWSWIIFIKATEDENKVNYRSIWFSTALFLLAVLSKELIITLPALFLLMLIIRKKLGLLELGKISGIFIVTGLIYMMWRYQVLGLYAFGGNIIFFAINPLVFAHFLPRIFTAFQIFFIYISKTFVPWNLSASYHFNELPVVINLFHSWQAVLGLAIMFLLMFLSFFNRTRATAIGLGAISFLVPYIVISKIFFKGGDIVAERWMYFPSVGLCIIGGYLLYLVFVRVRWLGLAILAVVISIYTPVLINRNKVWLSEVSLRQSMVETAPQSIQGYSGLAYFYKEDHRVDEAKEMAAKAYSIYDNHPPLLNTMGDLAVLEGEYALAQSYYLRAIEAAPFVVLGYQNLAKLYFLLGRYEESLMLLKYLTTEWSNPKIDNFIDLALVLSKLGRYEESLDTIKRTFGGDFSQPRVRLVLAINYFKMGNMEEAEKYFDWDHTLSEAEKIGILREF